MKGFIITLLIGQFSFADQTVKIGIASNFSEISSSSSNPYGDFFRDGIKLALEENQESLQKKKIKIELQEFDYGTSDVKVLKTAEEACKSQVSAVLGYVYSSHALLAAPIFEKCQLPLLTPSASADRLSEFKSFIHQGTFNNSFQGATLARVARKQLKATSAVSIAAADCAYCQDLSSAFKATFEKLGGRVIKSVPLLTSDTDYTSVVQALKDVSYDVILVPNHELLSARIIDALAKAGIQKPFLGGDGWGNVGEQFFQVVKGDKIVGYSVSHWLPTLDSPKSKNFVKAYQARFKKLPNDTAVLSYDSMQMLIELILKQDKPERLAIEKALQKPRMFYGATGKFDYSGDGPPKKSLVLLKNLGDHFNMISLINPSGSGN